jgi:hypothetical protein
VRSEETRFCLFEWRRRSAAASSFLHCMICNVRLGHTVHTMHAVVMNDTEQIHFEEVCACVACINGVARTRSGTNEQSMDGKPRWRHFDPNERTSSLCTAPDWHTNSA